MAFNYCALFGFVASVAVFILVALGGIIPEFVNAFVVRDVNDPTGSEPLANIGVFKSTYDASVLTPEQIAATGVPDDKFETPSLEFPLLFPGEENFVAQVLPINPTLAKSFEETTGQTGIVAGVTALVNNVTAVTFDSCAQYFEDITVALTTYFAAFQADAGLFPSTVNIISQSVAASFDAQFPKVFPNATVLGPQGVISGVLSVAGAIAAPVCSPVSILNEPIADQLTCLNVLFNGQDGILDHISGSACTGLTVAQCFFGTIAYDLEDGSLVAPPVFTTTALTSFCDVLLGDCSTEGLASYVFAVAEFLIAMDQADAGGLLKLYLNFFQSGLLTGATLSEQVSIAGLSPSIPTPGISLGVTPYPPCRLLSKVVLSGTANLTGITGQETTDCPITTYFPAVAELLTLQQNPLAPTVASVGLLYNACFGLAFTQNNELECASFFGRVFLNGAYRGNIENISFAESFIESGINECEDDETDNEKIGQAQVCFIIGWVFAGLTLIVSLAALLVKSSANVVLLSLAGVSSIITGGMVLAALFIVRSAPVYQGVGAGGEPEEDDIILREGVVVKFAKASAFMGILTGIIYFISACIASTAVAQAEEVDVEDKEAKEVVVPVKAEEVEVKADAVDVEEQI